MSFGPRVPAEAHDEPPSLRDQLQARLDTAIADILADAAAEREAAVEQARAAATAEAEVVLREALDHARDEAADKLAAALAEADERLKNAVAEARAQAAADAERAFSERMAGGNGDVERAAAAARQQAAAEADRALNERIDSVHAEAAERVRMAHIDADMRIEAARAAAEADVAAARAEADRRVEQAVADAEQRAAANLSSALAAARDEAARTLAARIAELEARESERVQQTMAAAQAHVASVSEELSRAQDEAERATAELAVLRAQSAASEREIQSFARVVEGLRQIDTATSLTQVLERLSKHALAAGLARVAVLVYRDRALRGWKAEGFPLPQLDVNAIDIGLDSASVVAGAARLGRPATTRDTDAGRVLEPLPFAPLDEDSVGLAVPLVVGGRTVAVLYADAGCGPEKSFPGAWQEAVEILTRHAARCLELMTVTRAYGLHADPGVAGTSKPAVAHESQAPARRTDPTSETSSASASASTSTSEDEDESAQRYARLLISEIKLYREDAVNDGRREADLLARLAPEISRARRLYEQRVPAAVRARADHFGQELIRTLANGDPRLLGQGT